MKDVVEGFIEKIIFRNEENGYTVFVLNCRKKKEEVVCVGSFTFVNEGELISCEGGFTSHSVYGEQFQVSSYSIQEPEGAAAIEKYLSSGAVKGIGASLAARIVKKFGADTFQIMEEEPERLSEIKGISLRKAKEIYEQFESKREMRSAMIFLQQYGISMNFSVKIYKYYGKRIYEVLKENPYRLAEDIDGIGFRIADEIALEAGILVDSEHRIRAGIIYVLQQASANGHTYLPEEEVRNKSMELLQIAKDKIEHNMMSLHLNKKIVIKESDVYLASYYFMELNTARMLLDLNIRYELPLSDLETQLKNLENSSNLILDERQRTAVLEAARNGLFILTGGPGTGKTTTIKSIIGFFESEGMDILLAAPTGRAAKRMKETTGREARTIHRMLELQRGQDQNIAMSFERNESNPLEADVIIVDEVSMVDIHLIYALLRAIPVGTRLILVGDVNQLPSVGPGNVLKDMIESKCFNVVKLQKIFRQAMESDITLNAHKINAGEPIQLDNKSKDFFFLKRDDITIILRVVLSLIQEKLPKYVQANPFDIQVLTPMRKGELGVERLNQLLQQYLNPKAPNKNEKEAHHCIFREGDKVMQIKNNYQIEWEMRNSHGGVIETGTGVFNGDSGIIREINLFGEYVLVEYEEGRLVEYSYSQLDELELAYAITIHKSQGSEYPAVILPLLSGPRLLMHRNLLYTAVTRAKSCVTLVGGSETVQRMIQNVSEQKRFSSLSRRIAEMAPLFREPKAAK